MRWLSLRIRVKNEQALDVIKSVCPYGDPRVINCVHCPVGSAPCEESEGIYPCTEEVLCAEGGHPSDINLCPYNALFYGTEGLYKCDMCIKDGYPRCVRASRDVYVELTDDELDYIGKRLGWIVYGEGDVNVDFYPVLSWEARVVERILDAYSKTRGEFSLEEVEEYVLDEIEAPVYLRERVKQIIDITTSPLGPLSLIKGEHIEEVVVVGLKRPVKVYVRGEGWKDTNVYLWTEDYFIELVNRASEGLGRSLSKSTPRINAVLKDGSRLHAVIPPVSNVHSLTVRRFGRTVLTVYHLIDSGFLSYEDVAKLWWAVEMEKNVLIGGNTGSGKTTLLNAILSFVPYKERIIIIEDTPEIRIPHQHVIRMIPVGGITMEELVKDTLRMRPDRVVVGEIRKDNEARAYMDTVLAGQGRGSYATIHGRSSEEVKKRLRSMGIKEEDLNSIDVIVIVKREQGKRYLKEITGIGSVRDLHERVSFLKENRTYDVNELVERLKSWYSIR